jgi:hypothetical protein
MLGHVILKIYRTAEHMMGVLRRNVGQGGFTLSIVSGVG